MTTNTQRIIFWSPRVLCILLALFLSVFALDVFSEGYGVGETMLALFMHLLPTLLLMITLIISWRWEWVGAIVFNALGLFLLISSGGESWFISVPLFLVGILFLVSWMITRRLKTT
jgi:hypothetical protein